MAVCIERGEPPSQLDAFSLIVIIHLQINDSLFQVNLCDLVISENTSLGNVTYSVSEEVMSLIQMIQKSDVAGGVLWKLPGLLPRSPALTASQTLLWISKLIMEVNSVSTQKYE